MLHFRSIPYSGGRYYSYIGHLPGGRRPPGPEYVGRRAMEDDFWKRVREGSDAAALAPSRYRGRGASDSVEIGLGARPVPGPQLVDIHRFGTFQSGYWGRQVVPHQGPEPAGWLVLDGRLSGGSGHCTANGAGVHGDVVLGSSAAFLAVVSIEILYA